MGDSTTLEIYCVNQLFKIIKYVYMFGNHSIFCSVLRLSNCCDCYKGHMEKVYYLHVKYSMGACECHGLVGISICVFYIHHGISILPSQAAYTSLDFFTGHHWSNVCWYVVEVLESTTFL